MVMELFRSGRGVDPTAFTHNAKRDYLWVYNFP